MTTPAMAGQLVPDEVWDAIQPLLPAKPPHPKGGRPWIEDRAVLGGIIDVLRAGVPWRLLPREGVGLWWRRDLLAAAARLATGRGLGGLTSSAAPGSWLPRRRDLRGLVDPGGVTTGAAKESDLSGA